jgi:DNA polymerase III epsilon subunit-like protein
MFITYLFYGALIALLIYALYKLANKPSRQGTSETPADRFIKESFDRAISEPEEKPIKESKKRSPNISITVEYPVVDDIEPDDPRFSKDTVLISAGSEEPAYIILDVETSGLRKYRNKDPKNLSNWPRIVQLAYQVYDSDDELIESESVIFKQPRPLPPDSIEIHGITDEMCKTMGVKPNSILDRLYELSMEVDFMVAHNAAFDHDVIEANMRRFKVADDFRIPWICTMEYARNLHDFTPLDINGRKKNGTLSELHTHLFGTEPEGLHQANTDTLATARCFFELRNRGIINIQYS